MITLEEIQRRLSALEAGTQRISKVTVVQLQSQLGTNADDIAAAAAVAAGAAAAAQASTILGILLSGLTATLNNGFVWVADEVNVKVKANSGLNLDTDGLAVLLEANKGLSMGGAGLSAKLKTKGGVLAGTAGLYLDLLLGVVTPLAPGAAVAVDFSLGCGFTLTPGEDETLNASNGIPGQRATLVITTAGTTSWNLTFGTNFKTQGVLATGTASGKMFAMNFWTPDGTTWYETGRTIAM